MIILWKNTAAGVLEVDLREIYLQITGEAIQINPIKNADDSWRAVSSHRLDQEKVDAILSTAEERLQFYKEHGHAPQDAALADYFAVMDELPEDWIEESE